MSRTTCRPPTSGAKTWEPARRALATLALAVLFGLAASEAVAAITFVKNIGTSSSETAGTTIAVTVPAAGVAAGDSIILTLAMGDASGTVSANDSSGVNTYSVAADVTNASNVRTVILAAHNVTALASGNTITVTHPSVSVRALSANEFSGLSPTIALDQTHTATGSSTAPSSGSAAATSEGAELLLGAMGVAGTVRDTFTVGASYTALAGAGTGIGFRGATSNSVTSATSLSLTRPSATAANDIMLASVTTRAGSGMPTITAPGWTSILSTNNGSTLTTATFWKVAGTAAADPGPYAFTVSSSSSVAGGISSYFDVDTTTPIDAFAGQANSSSTPSITTTVANTMLVAFFGRAGNSAIGAPADMSERFNVVTSGGNSSAAASETADRVQAVAGATGAEASTGNTATISQAVALKPATPAAVTIDPEYQIVSVTGVYSASGPSPPSGRRAVTATSIPASSATWAPRTASRVPAAPPRARS
ncbi:MAG: hypothetical protein E6J71_07790 [Deltaproteobacteria bacterium]|nr:MAG: hypothetical protein E6J71_07790 [Deltaproteobacteria bacterium]